MKNFFWRMNLDLNLFGDDVREDMLTIGLKVPIMIELGDFLMVPVRSLWFPAAVYLTLVPGVVSFTNPP